MTRAIRIRAEADALLDEVDATFPSDRGDGILVFAVLHQARSPDVARARQR